MAVLSIQAIFWITIHSTFILSFEKIFDTKNDFQVICFFVITLLDIVSAIVVLA